VVSGSAGPEGARNAARELVRCDAPVATLALAENPNGYVMGSGYQLPASPVPLVKLLAQQSGCFRVVDRAAGLAAAAFDEYRALPLARRAAFLEAIADQIMALGDALLERAHSETGLPMARLTGERGRTVGQLRLFAAVVRDGHFLHATIDPAQPQRQPLPRADLRLARVPL
uniref:aldehyde dehydrogenase family protein n=1 Tax=Raoultella sp. 18093 TaxID=2681425 RepID=UPI001D11681F